MDLPTLISRMSPFLILGVFGGNLHFYSDFNRTSCNEDPEQTLLEAVSDLGLHSLSMSQKGKLGFYGLILFLK